MNSFSRSSCQSIYEDINKKYGLLDQLRLIRAAGGDKKECRRQENQIRGEIDVLMNLAYSHLPPAL